MTIQYAGYGANDKWVEVTSYIRNIHTRTKADFMEIVVNDQLSQGVDPAFGSFKTLVVVLTKDGKTFVNFAGSNNVLRIPTK